MRHITCCFDNKAHLITLFYTLWNKILFTLPNYNKETYTFICSRINTQHNAHEILWETKILPVGSLVHFSLFTAHVSRLLFSLLWENGKPQTVTGSPAISLPCHEPPLRCQRELFPIAERSQSGFFGAAKIAPFVTFIP